MKVPFNEYETLELLMEEEVAEMNFLDRTFESKPTIHTASEVAAGYRRKLDTQRPSVTFTPNIKHLFDCLLIVVMLLVVLFVMISDRSRPARFATSIGAMAGVGALVARLLYRKQAFKIVVSPSGLEINGTVYDWSQIYEVYFIRRPHGRVPVYSLALALDTGLTDKYEITDIKIFFCTYERLCAYIEYYRQANK